MPSCDQVGVPGEDAFTHFHSSTTSGSASLMSLRILLRISPRQSPSSANLFEMSSDAGWPWLAPDFFMFSSRKFLEGRIYEQSRDGARLSEPQRSGLLPGRLCLAGPEARRLRLGDPRSYA